MKKLLSVKTALLVVCIVAIVAFGGVSLSRANLQVTGGEYTAQIGTENIGVALLEGDELISQSQAAGGVATHGTILSHLLDDNEKQIAPGKVYEERLSVQNIGTIDEYVRVIIQKRWEDADGVPLTSLDPELIDLHLLTTENGGAWILDEASSTDEQLILYYTNILSSGHIAAFADTLSIDQEVTRIVSQTEESGVITLNYDYKGAILAIDIEVDGVQTNNAEKAILSAWGVEVSINEDGSLQLPEGGAKE